MNQQDLERLETEAAEIVGAMKDLFREFEKQLGEIVAALADLDFAARGGDRSRD